MIKYTNSFSENLKTLRKHQNLSQEQLADKLNLSRSIVGMWESGQRKPSFETLELLADFFNVRLDDLSGRKNPNTLPITNAEIDSFISNFYNTPIFESVSAGFGVAAIDSVVDYIPLPYNNRAEANETICIRVKGDSMSPKIEDGDLIQVHKQSSVDSGDIAVVLIDDDEGFAKKVVYDTDYIQLISVNPYYPIMEFKGADVLRVSVVGKVKKIIRDL